MEREANYVAVGAFILLVIAMAVGFVLWYTDAKDSRDFELYEVYFAGSVSGLDRGSPVRYLGVDVGRVRRLDIDRDNPGRVVAVVEVDRSAPISSATRASLGLQGVTGLLYIDLREVPDVNKTKKLQVNGATGFTFNFENTATDYRSGNEFHFEWAVGLEFAPGLLIGVVGYDYRQLTGDTGSGARLGPFKGSVDAIGPGLIYTTLLGQTPFILNVRHYQEFNAQNRWEGNSTVLSGTIRY